MKRETREVNGTASPSADVSFLYAQDRATFGGSGNDALGGSGNARLGSKIIRYFWSAILYCKTVPFGLRGCNIE